MVHAALAAHVDLRPNDYYPMKRSLLLLSGAFLLLSACNAQGEEGSWSPAWKKTFEKKGSDELVLAPQDRNGPCQKSDDCISGLSCKGATDDATGTCQIICKDDADCGNGFLCRLESCQKDCAELNEKCSGRRVCCFFDQNNDRKNESVCADDGSGAMRCAVQVEAEDTDDSASSTEIPMN